MLRVWAVVCCVVAVMVMDGVEAAVSCDAAMACYPWSAPTCARGNNLNLRFFMEANIDYAGASATTVDFNHTDRTVTWAFCPRVDELQAFNLTAAPSYAAIKPLQNDTFVGYMNNTYVSVYGFGESNDREVPSNVSASTVMVARNGSDLCLNMANPVLLVDFLVFQIALTDGAMTYPGSVAPWNGTDGVSVQPQGVGFQPTCTGGVCTLDSSRKCIGDEGKQNCALCYDDPAILGNKTIQIWVSYYGTDNSGRRLLSGGSNPLNFRKYAGASVYSTLSTSLNQVSSGQALDPSVNV